jgi:hypothetical protein
VPRAQPPPQKPSSQSPKQNVLSEEEEDIIAEMLKEIRLQLPPDYEERRRRVLQVRRYFFLFSWSNVLTCS